MARTKQSARKRKSSDYASDNGFVENESNGSDRPTKRSKPTTSSSSVSARPQPQLDSDGNTFWEISKMRRVTISEFKGKQMVSVREYYEQNGEIKPGKKVFEKSKQALAILITNTSTQGISMPIDQYSAFVKLLPLIENELVKKGEKVPRPEYNGQVLNEGVVREEEDLSDAGDESGVPKKSNIEATSDEDED